MRWLCAIAVLAGGCADFAGIGDPAPLAPDAPPVPCKFGSIDLCLYAAPQNALVVGAPLVISTDRDCDIIYNHPIGRSACVLYARTIAINAKLSARGTRPLILAATEQLDVNGGVDVSSSIQTNSSYTGAAANDRDCVISTVVAAGPGGSFAGKGGDGGVSSASVLAVAAPAIPAPDFLRGGCPGSGNGDFAGGNSGVTGSGGAVALVAGGALTIGPAGQVLANGVGGSGGYEALFNAGGGGSGGMIVLTAPSITVSGVVAANGAGGGEGADGSGAAGAGTRGSDGTVTAMPASGGTGHPGGGDGGQGAAGTMLTGGAGAAGATTSVYADGAGGGGAGFIIVTGELNATGTISPTATRL